MGRTVPKGGSREELRSELAAVALAAGVRPKRKAPSTAFKKGDKKPPNSGRKKGTPNKFTGSMRQAAMEAFQEIGGPKWLAKLAKSNAPANRRAMAMFFSKMIPLQVTGEDGGPIQSRSVQVYVPDNGRGDGPKKGGG